MPDIKPFPEINGLLSGLRSFDNPSMPARRSGNDLEVIPDTQNQYMPADSPVSVESTLLWKEFMTNLRECPARCRKPDRLSYFIDKDIADSISECNIERRSNSDIINAILRTFLNRNLEQFNEYRQESRTLFNIKKQQS